MLETRGVIPGNHTGLQGGTVEVTYNASRHVGFTGQFSGSAGSQKSFDFGTADTHTFTFLVGPKITDRWDQFEVYAHFLFGGQHAVISSPGLETAHSPADIDFAMAVGGGVDWVGKGRFGWRIMQLEYMMSQIFASHTSYDRVSTGIVIRF